MIDRLWDWISKTNPDAWSAGAAWATTVIALIAGIAALRQVREARKLREEQSQPYVVAYMEQSQAGGHLIDLVVKNFGATAARDVRIYSEPMLKRSTGQGAETEEVGTFKVLPVLVPQQEWRVFWDSGPTRKNTALPDEHVVRVEYKDSRGRRMEPTVAVLDWSIYKNILWVEIFGPHHAAKALREIKDIIKKWGEFGKGLSVYVRDGSAKDARLKERYGRGRVRLAEIRNKLLPEVRTAIGESNRLSVNEKPAVSAEVEQAKQESHFKSSRLAESDEDGNPSGQAVSADERSL